MPQNGSGRYLDLRFNASIQGCFQSVLELEVCRLNEHLVRATRALEGRVAARQTVKRLRQRFETELGTLPVTLEPDQYGLKQ